jgi:hypothetical protein
LDIETRRQKQQALMIRMVERKVRERAQMLYEQRGQSEGHALEDWVQAESEVLGNTMMGPLYRRLRIPDQSEAALPESEAVLE